MATSPLGSPMADSGLLDGLRATIDRATDLKGLIGGGGSGGDGPRYRAFISYSHRDTRVARWLHRAIETFPVPRELVGKPTEYGPVPRRLSPVFRDEDELPGAAELGPKLEAALSGSAALIVLASTASARSVWVDREIAYFKTVNPDRPVLALIVDGAPGSAEECFPAALRLSLGADGVLVPDPGIEPLAPDLGKQDRQIVRLKIIAGLLGVTYNDLYRRDRRRARRFATLIGALTLLVVAALGALSVVAVANAGAAIRERNAARTAEALAEHNAEEAERRAWLAQVAATEVRRQTDLLAKRACR